MHYTSFLSILLAVPASQAISFPSLSDVKEKLSAPLKRQTACPAVWTRVAAELRTSFITDGLCNDDARAAIRAAFHDCGSWQPGVAGTGCDGSLILAPTERTQPQNGGLETIIPFLGNLATKYQVSVADMIQFAGSAAIAACPLGPRVQTFVGRTDNSNADDSSLLPSPFANASSILTRFAVMGFNAVEVVALIGAHTASKQFNIDPAQSGAAQDTTPGQWDVLYYGQTIARRAPFTFNSDISLSQHQDTAPTFRAFASDQSGFNSAFSAAMTKLSLLGVNRNGLIDCTSAVPQGTAKRDIKAAPIAARAVAIEK